MAEKTIYPVDNEYQPDKKFSFQNPATLHDTITRKKYILDKKGNYIIGRKDESIPQKQRATIEIIPQSRNGQGEAVEKKYEYMNPRHIVIVVEKYDEFYYHKVKVLEKANPIIADNKILTDKDDYFYLKPGSIICLPLVRIEVLDQQ